MITARGAIAVPLVAFAAEIIGSTFMLRHRP